MLKSNIEKPTLTHTLFPFFFVSSFVPTNANGQTGRMQQRLHGIQSSKSDQQIRPLPPLLDHSQPGNKRINGLRYAGHYALLFRREGVLSLAEASSGCLELGVKNSGHF